MRLLRSALLTLVALPLADCGKGSGPAPGPDSPPSDSGVEAGTPSNNLDAEATEAPEARAASEAAAEEPIEAGSSAAEPPTEPATAIIPLPHPGREPLAPPDLGPPTARAMIAIPAGVFLRGTRPGLPGRDPAREVDLVPTPVAAFEIDRLPFPNDPAQPAATNVTMREARARCDEAGKRLCTEVEWEYACKGPASQDYPYGDDYRADAYGDETALVSPFGVLAITARYEWTSGDWLDGAGAKFENIAALRGGNPDEGTEADRRCGSRTGLDPERASPRVGFRCCRGAGFPEPYAVEPTRRAFRPGALVTDAMFARLVRSVPELAAVHEDPRIQSEEQLRKALIRSNVTEAVGPGYVYSVQPVMWIPAEGDELIAFVGRSGTSLFTAALYTTGQTGVYVHAASLVLTSVPDDEGIALFGGNRDRKLLGWGECDDCTEGGSFEYHEEDRSITVGHRW